MNCLPGSFSHGTIETMTIGWTHGARFNRVIEPSPSCVPAQNSWMHHRRNERSVDWKSSQSPNQVTGDFKVAMDVTHVMWAARSDLTGECLAQP
ncbi:MAG TPA: hypothetical protein ENN34_00650 [Deltaproteobacteria bacterium]|nr:hypothetical protein [Deltaproteobacteria bacterium]